VATGEVVILTSSWSVSPGLDTVEGCTKLIHNVEGVDEHINVDGPFGYPNVEGLDTSFPIYP